MGNSKESGKFGKHSMESVQEKYMDDVLGDVSAVSNKKTDLHKRTQKLVYLVL